MNPYTQISLVALKVLYVNLGGYPCIKYANYFVFNAWTFCINLVHRSLYWREAVKIESFGVKWLHCEFVEIIKIASNRKIKECAV